MGLDSARVEAVFDEAVALSTETDRVALLDRACGEDQALRQRVEALLAAHGRADGFLEGVGSPARGAGETLAEGPGSVIGRYKLLEQIGEGGFGVVFMAEQREPVRRKVALKIIKLGMDTRQVVARFEAERQALAMMDHPNIAKVLDGGSTDTGRPYFVMELVRGIPITAFCDENRLTPRQRLELFLPVCSAIQHAHQKGIIHRDLKPNNVLVTMHDEKPVPMIIDFGIAKATQGRLTEATLFTEFRQFVGTPAYMSPEQAQMSALDIDTRSDVYSLGVLLYELLTGATPFDPQELRSAAHAEMQRIIREVEPPTPSRRWDTLAVDAKNALAARRRCDPKALRRTLNGEMDCVIMRCLEKDRTRRYETAAALSRDIQRYLGDEPVEASFPSTAYRLRKLLRKHKRKAIGLAAVAAALVLGLIGTSIGLVQARDNLAAARAAELKEASERKQAEMVAAALETMIDRLDPWDGNGQDLKSQLIINLDQFATELETDFRGSPLVQARLRDSAGWVELRLGKIAKAQTLLQEANDEQERYGTPDDAQKLRTEEHLAVVWLDAGQYDHAIQRLEEVLNKENRTLGANHPYTQETAHFLGAAYWQAGRAADAIRVLEGERNDHRLDADTTQNYLALKDLSGAYWSAGRTSDAIDLLTHLVDRESRTLSARHPVFLFTCNDLAEAYLTAGYTSKAIQLLEDVREKKEQILGAAHPSTLLTDSNLAVAYGRVGRYVQAASILEQAHGLSSGTFSADHPDRLKTDFDLALAERSCGHVFRAIELLHNINERRTRTLGEDDPETLATLRELARTLNLTGHAQDVVKALNTYRQGCLRRLQVTGKAVALSPADPTQRANYGGMLFRLGRYEEAMTQFSVATEAAPQNERYWHEGLIPLLLKLGKAKEFRSRRSEELRRFRATPLPAVAGRVATDALSTPLDGDDLTIALELVDRALAAAPDDCSSFQLKGMAEYRKGDYSRAIPWLIQVERFADQHCSRASADLLLAMCYQQMGDLGRAKQSRRRAKQSRDISLPQPNEGGVLIDIPERIYCDALEREADQMMQEKGKINSMPTTNPASD